MRRVLGWLREEALREAEAIRLPPGRPPSDDPLRRAALEARGRILREALLCARLVGREAPQRPEAFAAFLEDPHEGLVVETLRALGQWKAWSALPALLALYDRTKPSARPGGAGVLEAGGDARRLEGWRSGAVAEALEACLANITGRRFASPEELASWLETVGPLGRRRAG